MTDEFEPAPEAKSTVPKQSECGGWGLKPPPLSKSYPIRYSIIDKKNPREILLLRGSGCRWKRCRFCDYHLDFSNDADDNFQLNAEELNKVTGIHKRLEIINSGSFVDLDKNTMKKIESVSLDKGIEQLHFECHWNDRYEIFRLKENFKKKGVTVKIKTGVETFNSLFRESYLDKGIYTDSPSEISELFDECCLLQGLPGQTTESMLDDINIGLNFFERVCINIMQNNRTKIKADEKVIGLFLKYIYPVFKDNDRVDILMTNTDFGVGTDGK